MLPLFFEGIVAVWCGRGVKYCCSSLFFMMVLLLDEEICCLLNADFNCMFLWASLLNNAVYYGLLE